MVLNPARTDGRSFEALQTNEAPRRCLSAVDRLYRRWWPGCEIKRKPGSKLDRIRAIDATVTLSSGALITVQEKIRDSRLLTDKNRQSSPPCPDFTQEHYNGSGTRHESPGEWFHLYAHYYLYAWEGDPGSLAQWIMLDIPAYASLVESSGGLETLGEWRPNRKHGRASFYAIPISKLAPAVVRASPGLRRFLGNVDIQLDAPPQQPAGKCIHELAPQDCAACNPRRRT